MPDIFDEVSEDLRADRARALLRRYGALGVALMVLTLIGVGIYDYQEHQTGRSRSATADRFIAAQQTVTKAAEGPGAHAPPPDVQATFAQIAAQGPAGYRILAGLQAAALDWDAGRHDAAIAAWSRIAADGSAPQLLRELATLTSVQHQVDTGDANALKAQLVPLMTGPSRWRPLAEQVAALLDIRLGRTQAAREIMKSLAADPQAPGGVRQMAQDLLTTMSDEGAGPHG